ncbi:NADPH:quinone reductase-like Zn-dependent oxidoreductase [Streptomyces ambofaciens]
MNVACVDARPGTGRASRACARRIRPADVDPRARSPAHFRLLMDLARGAEIQPVVASTFPLEQAAQAQEELARRAHVGKIVMRP